MTSASGLPDEVTHPYPSTAPYDTTDPAMTSHSSYGANRPDVIQPSICSDTV